MNIDNLLEGLKRDFQLDFDYLRPDSNAYDTLMEIMDIARNTADVHIEQAEYRGETNLDLDSLYLYRQMLDGIAYNYQDRKFELENKRTNPELFRKASYIAELLSVELYWSNVGVARELELNVVDREDWD